MKFKVGDLRLQLLSYPASSFPRQRDYAKQFERFEDYMNTHVHPQIGYGAALIDGIYLNDHGPLHIATVISRATELAASKTCTLTPYEIYIFLCAVHVHDVGNFYGRSGHETIPAPIRAQIKPFLGNDAAEAGIIYRIAAAHGGTTNGNRDKISYLQPMENLYGQKIRPRFLAGLLRLGDELADDSTRAARFALDAGGILQGSEVFHKYSAALQTVDLDLVGSEIKLYFNLTVDDAKRRFMRYTQEVYLVDEILDRTAKMHRERLYCMRYIRPEINIDRILVTIKVYDDDVYADPVEVFGFPLEESGYPEEKSASALSADVRSWKGLGFNGANLDKVLRGGA